MCTISVSPRQKFLKHSRVLKQAWGREGWEASPCVCVCVCVCLSLGVCTHILVVGCFQPPSVTSNLPGSLGNSVTLFLNKRWQSLRERPAPPAPPPLPPFSSDLSRKECPYQLQKSRLAQKIQTCNPHLSDSDWCRYKSGFFFSLFCCRCTLERNDQCSRR